MKADDVGVPWRRTVAELSRAFPTLKMKMKGFEDEDQDLEFNLEKKPVKSAEYWSDVLSLSCKAKEMGHSMLEQVKPRYGLLFSVQALHIVVIKL